MQKEGGWGRMGKRNFLIPGDKIGITIITNIVTKTVFR
jgi:hypothetical protein